MILLVVLTPLSIHCMQEKDEHYEKVMICFVSYIQYCYVVLMHSTCMWICGAKSQTVASGEKKDEDEEKKEERNIAYV